VTLCTGASREWFVSEAGGVDDAGCGASLHAACRSLDVAVQAAQPGDVLRLDPATYQLPCVNDASPPSHGFVLQSLTITALNGSYDRPTISCQPPADAATSTCALRLDGVTLVDVDLAADDCHVTILSSRLLETTVYTTRTCRSLRMRMTRTDWTFSGQLPCRRVAAESNVSSEACRQTQLVNRLWCASVDVTLDRVRLVLGSLVIYSTYSTHIYVVQSQFTGDPEKPGSQFLGGLRLTFSAISANITIVNCVFSNQASRPTNHTHAALPSCFYIRRLFTPTNEYVFIC